MCVCVCVCVSVSAGASRQQILLLSPAFLRLFIFTAFLFACLTTFLCESVQIILCLCTIGPGRQLEGCVSLMLLRICCSCRVCENGWKVCAYFLCAYMWQQMTDGPAGRSRGRWMRWQTETDSPLSLRHNPSFSLPLFSFSACRDDAVPLVLWLRGGEGRGEDGEKVKRKKIAFIHNQCLLQAFSSSSPPILSHFCCHSPSISITSFLLHPPLCTPPLLIRISCLHRSFWSYSAPAPFIFPCQPLFFSTILIISKEFLPPRYAFSYLISVCTHTCLSAFFFFFCGCTSCILSGKFFIFNCQQECFHMYPYVMLF